MIYSPESEISQHSKNTHTKSSLLGPNFPDLYTSVKVRLITRTFGFISRILNSWKRLNKRKFNSYKIKVHTVYCTHLITNIV